MLKYITNILFLLLTLPAFAQDEDSTAPAKISLDSLHQLRIGIDISKPIINAFLKERQAYEFEVDYYHKKEMYWVAEAGWGSADVTDSAQQLVYNTTNIFFKAGFNKAMLPRLTKKDWDMAFIGLRYGIGFINRSDAQYITHDNFWGNTMGIIPAKSYTAHWAELTGGVRVELVTNFFVGWNVRARFMLNRKSFSELPPSYIAGYGRGDKGSVFDFNFYLNYGIRWKKKSDTVTPVPVTPAGEKASNINKPSENSRNNTAPVK